MRLLYATSVSYPSRLANRIQTMAMAIEFAKVLGNNFYLGGLNIKKEEERKVTIINFPGTQRSFFLAFKYLRFCKQKNVTHIFCREEKLLFFLILYNTIFYRMSFAIIYESHFLPTPLSFVHSFVLKHSDIVIMLTTSGARRLIEMKLDTQKLLVLPDGVNVTHFDSTLTKTEARKKLNLPIDSQIILYTGSLYSWKGVETLIKAASHLGDVARVVIAGGNDHDIEKIKKEHDPNNKVTFVGYQPHQVIPLWLRSADILVLPNTAKDEISKWYTSPLKLFEYMASGTPIVASNLPSLRDIVNNENAYLVEPDDSKTLALGIEKALSEKESAKRRAEKAKEDVKKYSWNIRVHAILDSIKQLDTHESR